jgi:hypothetical protein
MTATQPVTFSSPTTTTANGENVGVLQNDSLLLEYNPNAPDQYVIQYASTINASGSAILTEIPNFKLNLLRYPSTFTNPASGAPLQFHSYLESYANLPPAPGSAKQFGWPFPNLTANHQLATAGAGSLSADPILDFATQMASIYNSDVTGTNTGTALNIFYDYNSGINIMNFLMDPTMLVPAYVAVPITPVSYALVPNPTDPTPCPPVTPITPKTPVDPVKNPYQISNRLVAITGNIISNGSYSDTVYTVMPHVCGNIVFARKIGSQTISLFAY